jgi:hypothetical protein
MKSTSDRLATWFLPAASRGRNLPPPRPEKAAPIAIGAREFGACVRAEGGLIRWRWPSDGLASAGLGSSLAKTYGL